MPDDFKSVTIADASDEGPRLRALVLDPGATGFASLFTIPGQYVKARASSDAKEAFLALAGKPGTLELLVQKTGNADHAADRVASLSKGASLEITAPAGKGFSVASEKGRDLLLFAGGSGISAIRSIVEHVAAARGEFGRVVLLYGARQLDDLAYRSRYDGWKKSKIEVEPALSRAIGPPWSGRTGYVTDALPSLSLDPAKTSVFLAGGKDFLNAAITAAAALGIPPERMFKNF